MIINDVLIYYQLNKAKDYVNWYRVYGYRKGRKKKDKKINNDILNKGGEKVKICQVLKIKIN